MKHIIISSEVRIIDILNKYPNYELIKIQNLDEATARENFGKRLLTLRKINNNGKN